MSFGESVFSAGFNQEDLFIKGNHGIPPHNRCGKTLEYSRKLSTEAGHMSLTCGAARPHMQAGQRLGSTSQPLVAKSVLHHLLGCIYAVLEVGLFQGLTMDALAYITSHVPPP